MTRPVQAIIGAMLTAQASAEKPHNVTEAVAMAGGGKRGNSTIAQMLAGTSDKKSAAYKAKLRSVQRYLKAEEGKGGEERHPNKATRAVLDRIFGQLARLSVENQMRVQGATMKASGDVRVSDDERYRDNILPLFIPGEVWGRAWDALHDEDFREVDDSVQEGYFDAYDLPGGRFTDIDDIDITAGATPGAVLFGR